MSENGPAEEYPSIRDIIHEVLNHENFPEGPVYRLEVNVMPNGDATFRVWAPGAEEPEGGAIQGR